MNSNEKTGEMRWNDACNEQGWDEASKIIHLEGFLRERGLFDDFALYAEAAAADEDAGDVPDAGKRLIEGSSAYGLVGGLLVCAPMLVDGSIDESNWGPVEFGHIADDDAANCRLIQQALEAMDRRDQ